MRTFRTAIVGLGSVSTVWLEALTARDDVELVAFVDANRSSAERQRDAFSPATRVFEAVADALAAEKPDFLVNATPPALHRPVTEAALAAGCDVLVEKPLADTLSSAAAMTAAAERAGRTLAVMQNRRHHPAVRALRNAVESGRLGTLLHLCSDMFMWHKYTRPFLAEAPHPLLSDMAIHQFDAARFVSGVEPVAVFATEWTSPTSWFSGPAAAACTFELEGGAVYSYRGSWIAEGLKTSYDGAWRVGGTAGSAVWDGEGRLDFETVERVQGPYASGVETNETIELTSVTNGHAAAVDATLDAMQAGEAPDTVAADNLLSLAMVEASRVSSVERRRVELAEVLAAAGHAG